VPPSLNHPAPSVEAGASPGRTAAAPAVHPFPRLPITLAPDPKLLTYYALSSLLLGPFFLFALVPLYFRYHTLRYTVDEEGISMRWGILFRREISLTYARIQDIHLTSNVVERWLGLARVQVQTASGSAAAEMTIEGFPSYDAVRDFLYTRMRGSRPGGGGAAAGAVQPHALGPEAIADLTLTLREVAAELRALRAVIGAPETERGQE
jgi:membrane protein YdbS with pleckstrin-like domain